MKKKTIEKIPYITLGKTSRKKEVKYIGVTTFKTISHEKHLFLEVYKNSKETKEVPVVRIVLTKKDFGTFFPETGEWSRAMIVAIYGRDMPIWYEEEDIVVRARMEIIKKNILQSDEDLERIKEYCNVKIWDSERWWEYIESEQDDIATKKKNKARERKYKKRKEAIEDRIKHTRPLPEKKILEKADRYYFRERHYLYYKKHGCWAKIACSKCGRVTDARWKMGITPESEFQIRIKEPKEGKVGKCPMCKAQGIFKCQGKVKGSHSETIHLFLGQKYKEKGMVVRYIEVSKTWFLNLICGEKGPEMFNAYEELSGIEIARAYFEPGKKTQIDYHKHSPYSGENYWDDCNLYGMNSIVIKSAMILSETYEEIKGTMFQYCALKEYAEKTGEVNMVDYLERYLEFPQIEMLAKLGMTRIVTALINNKYSIQTDETAKRPDMFLGIRKERVKMLIEEQGDIDLLNVMKIECRLQRNWSKEQLIHLSETGLGTGQVESALRYMSLQKLLNRIEKYAGCGYEGGCSMQTGMIQQTATRYMDYLSMREQLGYDLRNSIYQQPKNLQAAHNKMVMELNKEEEDKRLKEVKVKYPNIRKNYRKLRKKYYFEDEEYIIRPARSAEEIVIEGRVLHHCVGGDLYLKKHDGGKTYILMLRDKNDPELPYITIEINAMNDSIIQWYGAHDKKPDEKRIREWLGEYVNRVKSGMTMEKVEVV